MSKSYSVKQVARSLKKAVVGDKVVYFANCFSVARVSTVVAVRADEVDILPNDGDKVVTINKASTQTTGDFQSGVGRGSVTIYSPEWEASPAFLAEQNLLIQILRSNGRSTVTVQGAGVAFDTDARNASLTDLRRAVRNA